MESLNLHLIIRAYRPSKADQCVIYKHDHSGTIIMAVTIDEFLFTTNSEKLHQQLFADLAAKYSVYDQVNVKSILDWTIRRI